MEDRRKVVDFEVQSHGIEHSQYFQGAGVAFTDWEEVAVGVGESEREALEDALESLAQDGWDVANMDLNVGDFSDRTNVHDDCLSQFALDAGDDDGSEEWTEEWDKAHDECELHYFVAVYVR